ncbi:MAG TPA: hypothetical protein VHE34_24330 [Puia sp.]|uniref:hypothetical protein n=1 Tax=Puia sp. TaxID=2045100 RepID=UPI002BEFAC58|nr:hypothetical protein [Puia sp.]HVU98383.1 hypothetical protein [Puia sp.]
MKTILSTSLPTARPSLFSFEPNRSRTKVSLHNLVDQLLIGLQPLAMRRDNVVVNGIPEGICFIAEENLLAYVLWNLVSAVINTKQNECIYVQSLVDDERTFVGVKDAGTYLYRSLASEFRKLQHAAAQFGASIDCHNDHNGNANIVLSMSNRRLAV